jgi:hypothetical protein
MKKTMTYFFIVLLFSNSAFNTSLLKQPDSPPSVDTVFIAVQFIFPDNTAEEIKHDNYFFELLKNDFKKKEEKSKKHFEFLDPASANNPAAYQMKVTFFNLKIGDEKREQNTRLASREKAKTVFDQAAQEHKVQSEIYQADITHIKKTVACTIDITVEVDEPGKTAAILNKTYTGNYTWINDYITYTGAVEPLTTAELKLARNRDQNPPLHPTMIRYLLQNSYIEISGQLYPVFKESKAF